ncbi:hypothetical protein [Sphingomonas aquatilis]
MKRTTCRDCDKPLSARAIQRPNSTGYCAKCAPKHHWTPESRARASAARKARWDRELADPELRAKAVESGKRLSAATPRTREIVEKQIAGRRASHWLPEGYEALNRQLKAKGYRAVERKALIAEEVARLARKAVREEQDRLARMTPHERAMERVRNGATLTTKPVMRKADHAFSLTGSSMG